MACLLSFVAAHRIAAVLAAGVMVPVAAVIANSDENAQSAVVGRVIDGDTIDVEYDGDTHRVRLLNVDTPETVDPDEPVQCLGRRRRSF